MTPADETFADVLAANAAYAQDFRLAGLEARAALGGFIREGKGRVGKGSVSVSNGHGVVCVGTGAFMALDPPSELGELSHFRVRESRAESFLPGGLAQDPEVHRVDRTRRGDRRKMLSKKIKRLDGDKIFAVVDRVRGRFARVVERELFGDPATIREISENEPKKKDYR